VSGVRRGGAAALSLGLLAGALAASTGEAGAVSAGTSGRVFFQSDREDGTHLYSMNPDGSRLVRLTYDEASTSPALSPDGTRLAYIGGGDVSRMEIDGSDADQLTDTAAVAG
jgi:Tol biopolymer transport system component